MAVWLILVLGLALGSLMVVAGIRMVRPQWGEQRTRTDAGIALVTASVISIAVFVLQVVDEDRSSREQNRRQAEIANEALRIQLALSPRSLREMDLSGENLRNVNLPGRDLSGAQFVDADLRQANLRGAILRGARFVEADLEEANLDGAKLQGAAFDHADLDGAALNSAILTRAHLDEADLVGAQLYYADLRCARAEGANLDGAVKDGWKIGGLEYDETTIFPNGKRRPCADPPCQRGPCRLR